MLTPADFQTYYNIHKTTNGFVNIWVRPHVTASRLVRPAELELPGMRDAIEASLRRALLNYVYGDVAEQLRGILTRIEKEHHAHPLLAELIERLTGQNPA